MIPHTVTPIHPLSPKNYPGTDPPTLTSRMNTITYTHTLSLTHPDTNTESYTHILTDPPTHSDTYTQTHRHHPIDINTLSFTLALMHTQGMNNYIRSE